MAPGQLTEQSIRQMVDTFYLRVRQDAELGPIFENRLAGKWDAHMPRMYAFWTKLLLGTGDFQSDVFGKHMSLENLQKEHFARWLTLFRETAVEVLGRDAGKRATDIADRIAGNLQLGYFGIVENIKF
jgi:hemoglobin